jgi:hypothetical protein
VIYVAYFDRLARSLKVQHEVLERVEQAGGSVIAVDTGEIRTDTASRWLSATTLGMVAEYHRLVTAEKVRGAHAEAIKRKASPVRVPPGYRRDPNGVVEVDPDVAPIVAEAFRMRADGATVMEVRAYLAAKGIKRSFHGVQSLLTSRFVLGELKFGKTEILDDHTAIVDRETWGRVQRMRSTRGRRPKSERLLARLGILRCATCGGRMVVGTQTSNGRSYPFYRCSPVSDCPNRVTVSAELVEGLVVDEVKRLVGDLTGTASYDGGVKAAEQEFENAERELDAAVEAFSGLDDVESARRKLTDLREARDAAGDRLRGLRAARSSARTVTVADWDDLSLDGRRGLIRAVIERVDVGPGRGEDRITIRPHLLVE